MGRHRIAFTLVAIVLAVVAGSGAPGGAADQQQVASVNRTAYFTRPATAATPPLLVEGFPPSTACLVAGLVGFPELCGEEVQDLAGLLGLGDGLPVLETIDADLVQPVVPGTLPVGMAAGQERYTSVLRFDLPTLPEGQRFGSLELLLRPDGVSFAVESPAFRELVLAAVSQISETDPERFAEVLADVAEGEVPLVAETITGIEACPAMEQWDGGDAQNAGLEGTRLPDVDCLIGTTGTFENATSSWVFDLTFAAQAWTTGGTDGETIANEGIVLRPLGAENLAYGDPDLSTNWLVSLAGPESASDLRPRLRYSVVPEATSPGITPDVAAPSPSPSPVSPSTPSPPPVVESPGTDTRTVIPATITARYAERAASATEGTSPWWLLLLIPAALIGAWMLGESLFAVPATSRTRGGALDQLMRHRRPPGGDHP